MSCRTCGAVYGNVMHHEKDIICYHEYDDGWNLMARPIPERFPARAFDDIAKLDKSSDSIEDLQAMSQRNCAVGCRFFGTNLVHFICEVETIHDIVLRQDGKFEEIRRIASGMVVGPIKPLGLGAATLGLVERVLQWLGITR